MEFYDVSRWDGTSAAYFLPMFLYLFLLIFPCSMVEIKLIGFAFEEGEENREVKESAVTSMLLIKTRNRRKGKAWKTREMSFIILLSH